MVNPTQDNVMLKQETEVAMTERADSIKSILAN